MKMRFLVPSELFSGFQASSSAWALDKGYLSQGVILTGLKGASVRAAMTERYYDIQTNILRVPPHLGFFSWGLSHPQRAEGFIFVRWAQFCQWAVS
ncbi:hypothetical protein CORC01_11014 [Colletotrichum orchidophilum]|uniref:Uncharacterized protein n=1 Tax=Colletotrichum orchidophilum TaxID=1209926 RepID=A0A1G4AX30_9PEZI|nr:uncharacterized protein CORC01_11014 [Colletotrichum orchidophilum]OHE93697.1 hypothetical protein CORC01_11014 [Colletotrichum orchidophilum]